MCLFPLLRIYLFELECWRANVVIGGFLSTFSLFYKKNENTKIVEKNKSFYILLLKY